MNWSTHRNQTICHTCSCLVCTSFANPMHIAAEPKLAYNANSIGACMIYMCHKCMFHVNPLKGLSALESTREHQHLESMATSTPTAWSIRRGTSTRAWWSIRSVTKRLHHVQEARFELHGKTAQFKNRRSRRGLPNVVISAGHCGLRELVHPRSRLCLEEVYTPPPFTSKFTYSATTRFAAVACETCCVL